MIIISYGGPQSGGLSVHTIYDAETAPKAGVRVVSPASRTAGQAVLQRQLSSQQRAYPDAPRDIRSACTDVTACREQCCNKQQPPVCTRLPPLTEYAR